MRDRDIVEFDDFERELLDGSFNPTPIYQRMRTVVVLALLVAGLIALFAVWNALTIGILIVVFLAYVAVAAAEKLSYAYTMLRFESLVRKLVHRIESLEGVPLTPDAAEHVSVTPRAMPRRP